MHPLVWMYVMHSHEWVPGERKGKYKFASRLAWWCIFLSLDQHSYLSALWFRHWLFPSAPVGILCWSKHWNGHFTYFLVSIGFPGSPACIGYNPLRSLSSLSSCPHLLSLPLSFFSPHYHWYIYYIFVLRRPWLVQYNCKYSSLCGL